MLLRHLRVLAENGLGSEIDVLEPARVSLVALPSDCDLNFHVNNARYLRLMDLGRLAHVTRSGILRAAVQNRWNAVVGGAEIEFLRELPLLRSFTLSTRIVGWDAKWFYFEQRFERGRDLAAVGRVQIVVRSSEGNVPTAEVMAALGPIRSSPPLPETFAHLGSASPHRQGRRRRGVLAGVHLTMDDLPGLGFAA